MRLRGWLEEIYARHILRQCVHIPSHIAIIQDGNRRFARNHGMPATEGYRLGAGTTERVLDWSCDLGIKHITLYCFSTENFQRKEEEVRTLFDLFHEAFMRVLVDERFHRHRIRVRVMGERSLLPPDLIEAIEAAEEATRGYSRYFLNIALAYGGRNEILSAARSILRLVHEGEIRPDDIDGKLIEAHLSHGLCIPPVDLIIRTGNERRTSNFLPWLANGNECTVYFCAPYWPEFRKIDFLRAIRTYDQRVREQREAGITSRTAGIVSGNRGEHGEGQPCGDIASSHQEKGAQHTPIAR